MGSAERFKVYGNVFDNYTINNLNRLSARGLFDELKSPISIGKEANIFSATQDSGEIIVKIYRLESCNFNKMYEYLSQDPRNITLKKQRRKIVFAWTQREYRNIMKARDLGINVPLPLEVLDNIILLELLGHNNEVAPKIKDLDFEHFGKEKTKKLFDDIIRQMAILHKGKIVHGDLSEFNILYNDEEPYFIDFSQATTSQNHQYDELLERDIRNIVRFFRKKGLNVSEDDVKTIIFKK